MGRACGLSYADAMADVERIDLAGVMIPVARPAAPRSFAGADDAGILTVWH
jgi:hypothetical protein